MTTLLAIENLKLGFVGTNEQDNSSIIVPTLHGVSLSVEAGKITALVGASGSGKTLTSRTIVGLLPRNARMTDGRILFQGKDLAKAIQTSNIKTDKTKSFSLSHLRGNEIAMVFQDPLSSLNPLHTIEKQVAEPLLIHKHLKKPMIQARVKELFSLVGLESSKAFLKRYPHQLSGGQRQRVALAMALANKPKLLIADEPTTALDASIQNQILECMNTLCRTLNMGVLIVSHDLGVVRSLADTIHVMDNGSIVESGSTQAIFNQAKSPITKALLGAEGPQEAVPLEAQAPVILEGKNITMRFERRNFLGRLDSAHIALENVSFSLQKGECLGIVGESGSGKSTLALAILRLLKAKGEILFHEQALNKSIHSQDKENRRKIQAVFQDPFASLNPRMTILENIAEGLMAHFPELRGEKGKEAREKCIEDALLEVGLVKDHAYCYPNELSGGQCQRAVIARALVLRPEILILDEATSSLDRALQFQILTLLRELQFKYTMSCLFITHDISLVRKFCHRVMVLQHGHVINCGQTKAIFP